MFRAGRCFISNDIQHQTTKRKKLSYIVAIDYMAALKRSRTMRQINLYLLVFFPLLLYSNVFGQSDVTVGVCVYNHCTYAPLDAARIKLIRDEVIVDSSYTDKDGRTGFIIQLTSVEEVQLGIPTTFTVSENYPNPFRDETQVDLLIPESRTVRADVYNILGQQVLSEEFSLSAGYYSMKLSLSHLSTGIYFLRLQGHEQHAVKLMKIGGGVHYSREIYGRGSIQMTPRSIISLPLQKISGGNEEYTIQVEKDRYEVWSVKMQIDSDMELTIPLVLLAEHLLNDIDGNVYQTVKIGSQLWMAENLRVTRYRNRDPIPTGLSNTVWRNTTSGAYALYPHGSVVGINSDEEMLEVSGALYNWYAVDDDRGICPEYWRVPRDGDWTAMVDYVVSQGYPDTNVVGGAGNALKSRRQVDSPFGDPWATSEHPRWDFNSRDHGLDVFSFSGLPGGFRIDSGNYGYFGILGRWWSSTEFITAARYRFLYNGSGNVGGHGTLEYKQNGFSVRCLRDD
jgi:uncharacterized protein (TIGR02145 family)